MLGKIILLIIAFAVIEAIFPSLVIPAAIIVAVAIFIYIQYYYCHTFVEEGTCKNVMRGKEFRKSIMSWQDHLFKVDRDGPQQKEADNWEIVEGKTPKSKLGGFRRFTWIPFLDKIDFRRHRWAHVHEDGRIAKHEEWQNFALVKRDIYAVEIRLSEEMEGEEEKTEAGPEEGKGAVAGGKEQGAEDKDGIPLGVAIGLPMWQYNPYIANFIVRRWYPMIATIVRIRLRQFVAGHKYKEELLPMAAGKDEKSGGLWEEFWKLLKQDFITEGAQEHGENIRIYGMEILKQGAGMVRVDPSKDYREATTREYIAEQNRKVTIIGAEAEARAIVIRAIAQAKAAKNTAEQKSLEAGDMYKKIRKTLMDKCSLPSERADELAADFTKYWKGTEEQAITDWRFTGADGSILAEIAKIVGVAEISKQRTTEKPKEKVAEKPQKTS